MEVLTILASKILADRPALPMVLLGALLGLLPVASGCAGRARAMKVAPELPVARTGATDVSSEPWTTVWQDHRSFYDLKTLSLLTLGVAAMAPVASSSVDEDLFEDYQNHLRSSGTDDVADIAEELGDHLIMIPVWLGGMALARWGDDPAVNSQLGQWSQQSLRSLLVGTPPLLLLQRVTGASRPRESVDSDWGFFQDSNGVSGHAFVGAIPLLVAGRMCEDRWLRYSCYALSLAPGVARLNNQDHYPSQVLLGWWIALLSVESIRDSDSVGDVEMLPWITPDATGIQFAVSF